jgi:hypothetical protein
MNISGFKNSRDFNLQNKINQLGTWILGMKTEREISLNTRGKKEKRVNISCNQNRENSRNKQLRACDWIFLAIRREISPATRVVVQKHKN